MKARLLRLALVGDVTEPLRLLLEDAIMDNGVCFELTTLPSACDVVLVLVNWGEELRVIAEARALAGAAPLLAILPFSDDGLAERVLLGGAQSWFALDTSLALLRTLILQLADLGDPADKNAA